MKKNLFVALSACAAFASHAEVPVKSLELQNTTVTAQAHRITAPDGQSIVVTSTVGEVNIAHVAASTMPRAAGFVQSGDTACPIENNGLFAETVDHQLVICSNGKWHDAASLPMTRIRFEEFDMSAGKMIRQIDQARPLGVQSVLQSSDERTTSMLLSKVVAINPDDTARISLEFLDASGQRQQVDTTVKLGRPTVIASGPMGHEYRVRVIRS
ncbi:hypothetical protein [Caballeronia sp. LZ035]|uniref:hypothetical protein n=1 Tax=Caballeronia sp. LZ035 TaxID=3038568 RepID=UPI002863C764|nr:hypothetical protein [Caballeronia sp. LZ035]MDR5762981.1 hypothetical protein [Caballeronia sp. LZ035]